MADEIETEIIETQPAEIETVVEPEIVAVAISEDPIADAVLASFLQRAG